MSILSRLRRTPKKSEPETRIMPKPVQVRMSDVSTHTGGFTQILEWDTYHPIPVSFEIPELEVQVREIEKRILAHAAAGALDGLVPDLLDREIHHRCAEIKARIDTARERNLRQLTEFCEQAKRVQADLRMRAEDLRRRRARSQREFDKAWEELTGEAPAAPESAATPTFPPSDIGTESELRPDPSNHKHPPRAHHHDDTVVSIDR